MSAISTRITDRNDGGEANVLTISAEHGLISQKEYFNRRVASDSLDGYFTLQRGDFAYNKSYSKGYPLGAIRRLERYPSGVVSPLYICFRPHADRVDANFLAHYLDGGAPDAGLADVAKEGVRNHGLLNVGAGDFFQLPIALPPLPEQAGIAEVLDTLDTTIRQTEAIIEKLKQVKQGLLHDLLTRGIDASGELRPAKDTAPHLYMESPLGWIPKDWAVTSLDDACSNVVDCPHSTPNFVDSGVLVARTMHIKEGRFLEMGASYVSEAEFKDRVARARPEPGDVVFTREAPVGEAFVIPPGMRICLGQRVMLLRPRRDMLRGRFLVAQIYSGAVADRISALTAGTTNPHLNVADVRRFVLPLPPVQEQELIEQKIDRLEDRIHDESALISKLGILKSGLMDDLLTGRVRVTPLLAQPATP